MSFSLDRSEEKRSENISTSELAEIFYLTTRRIQQLSQEGMPKISDGVYPFKECVRWYIRHLQSRLDENNSDTILQEKIRLYRAKAEKAEIEARRMNKYSIAIEEVTKDLATISAEIKDAFQNIPGYCAPRLEDKPAGFIKNFLTRKILDTLNFVSEKLDEYSAKIGGIDTKIEDLSSCSRLGCSEQRDEQGGDKRSWDVQSGQDSVFYPDI